MEGALKDFLDKKVDFFENSNFIINDPICIPHRFSLQQDIEIIAFWTATLAWGQRKSIIRSAENLTDLMDNAPYDFIVNHEEKDRKKFLSFVHRTFQPTDTLYFLEFLQYHYRLYPSLETAFTAHLTPDSKTVEAALIGFHHQFFSLPFVPDRTKKHVSHPPKSTCKRLNMFLRWMVRSSEKGVDFGLWKNIQPAQLLIPLDVHVERQARLLNLFAHPKSDWKAVLELTDNLRTFDSQDPVKYDFALFGMGVIENSKHIFT